MDPVDPVDPVTPPDAAARREAVERCARAGGPGALGRLEELAGWLAACQGRSPARALARPRVVLLAAEHGVAGADVSAHPPGATRERVGAVAAGDAAVCSFAAVAGAGIRLVDVGMTGERMRRGADDRRLREGSGRIDREDALTADEVGAALRLGRELVDEEVDAGTDLLIPADLAVGASTPAAVLVAATTGGEPVAVVGRGSGVDDHAWMRKAAAVRDALWRARTAGRDPEALLAVAGGVDLAVATGFLAQAARRRTPVLLDGVATTAAALLADRGTPGARQWWVAASRCPEPSSTLALEVLDTEPLLGLALRAGQGTGALAALPLLQMAAAAGAGPSGP